MKTPRTCATAGCAKPAAPTRTICTACHSRKVARANPLKACFRYLKANAKRRKKDFTLTLEQFAAFAVKTEYLSKRGKHRTGYTIDRIDPTQGYHFDNIQPLTNSENVKKQAREQRTVGEYNHEKRQMEFFTIALPPSPPSYCPF